MAITPKEKELVAIGISVAAGCKPCTDHHVTVAKKARATGMEMRQAVVDSLLIRHRAADIMEAHALDRLNDEGEPVIFDSRGKPNRMEVLVSVGAAFAVNCTSSLEHSLATAKAAGVSQDDIMQIVKLAAFIKRKAASHVERLVGMTEEETAA
jgi:AhpD family alkylhydroperoxidase